MSLVQAYASKLENLLKDLLPRLPNEAEFRQPINRRSLWWRGARVKQG